MPKTYQTTKRAYIRENGIEEPGEWLVTHIRAGQTIREIANELGWQPWMKSFPLDEPLYEMEYYYDHSTKRYRIKGVINNEISEVIGDFNNNRF